MTMKFSAMGNEKFTLSSLLHVNCCYFSSDSLARAFFTYFRNIWRNDENFVLFTYRDKYDRTSDTKFWIVCCKFITSSQTFGIWEWRNKEQFNKFILRKYFIVEKVSEIYLWSSMRLSLWREESKNIISEEFEVSSLE
jgi:hypothetical protein